MNSYKLIFINDKGKVMTKLFPSRINLLFSDEFQIANHNNYPSLIVNPIPKTKEVDIFIRHQINEHLISVFTLHDELYNKISSDKVDDWCKQQSYLMKLRHLNE